MKPTMKSLAVVAILAATMLPAAAQAGWCGCRVAPPRPFLGFLEPLVEAAPNIFFTEPTSRYYPRVTCCGVRTPHYTYIPGEYGPLYIQPDLYPPRYFRPHIYPRVYRSYRHRVRRYHARPSMYHRTYRHRTTIERAVINTARVVTAPPRIAVRSHYTRRNIRHVKRHWND